MDAAANWLLGVGEEDYLPDPATTLIPLLFEPVDEPAALAFEKLKPRKGAVVLGFGAPTNPSRWAISCPFS